MWDYIERMNWAEMCKQNHGYYAVKRVLMESYSKSIIDELDTFVRERVAELIRTVDQFDASHERRSGDYGGDDSHGDMMYHVIGLGMAKFDEIMADPSKLNGMDFTESFSYCFPHEGDYEKLKLEYHQEYALKCIDELVRIIRENEPSSDDLLVIKALIDKFMLVLAGDVEAVVKGYSFKKDYNKLDFESNDCCAMFSNGLYDLWKYMG
jgi:hypothetical protein